MTYQQKVHKQEFCDSTCYKIPYFTDSTFSHIVQDVMPHLFILLVATSCRIVTLSSQEFRNKNCHTIM